jgi:hypothetical protein
MRQVQAKPARDARRKRGNDDLVELAAFDRLLHGRERIAVADDSLDVPTRGLVEQRQCELERGRCLLGIRIPIGARHEQREAAGGAAGTARAPRRAASASRRFGEPPPARAWGLRRSCSRDCRAPPPTGSTTASRPFVLQPNTYDAQALVLFKS